MSEHICTFCPKVAGIRVALLAAEHPKGEGWICQACLEWWLAEKERDGHEWASMISG